MVARLAQLDSGVDDSTEFQAGCVHRAVTRPDRTPTMALGLHLALSVTLRLPWGGCKWWEAQRSVGLGLLLTGLQFKSGWSS